MKYMKLFKEKDAEWFEVNRETALDTILGSYIDNEEVHSWVDDESKMLNGVNVIKCKFSFIAVCKDDYDISEL